MIESARLIKRLEKEGWELDRITGSHHTFKKEGVLHIITVPHPKKDLKKGTKRTIEKAAGWR